MRDPNRIDPLIAKLRTYWLAHPDLRFGQIVSNFSPMGGDPFYVEDSEIAACLDARLAAMPGTEPLEKIEGLPTAEDFRLGLPPEALRKVWPAWDLDCGYVYEFVGDTYRGAHWESPAEPTSNNSKILRTSAFRPHGSTWSAVEFLAVQLIGTEDGKAGRESMEEEAAYAVFPLGRLALNEWGVHHMNLRLAYQSAHAAAKGPHADQG